MKEPIVTSHNRSIRRLDISSTNILACCSFDATVSLYNIIDHSFITKLEGHENEVKCVTWSPSSSLLATCSRDKTVWLWKKEVDGYECCSVLTGHTGDVKCVTFYSEDICFSGSFDGTMCVWKGVGTEWTEKQNIKVGETVWDIHLINDYLICGCAKGLLQLYKFDKETLQLTKLDEIKNEKYRDIYTVKCNNDRIALACGDNSIKILTIVCIYVFLELNIMNIILTNTIGK